MAVGSLIGAILGAAILLQVHPGTGIPAATTLMQASGKVAWVQNYKYGTRFGLVGVPEKFDYPSKASGMGVVRDALTYAGDKVIAVRYENAASGPIYSDDKYHVVWSLQVGNQPVRTYAESVSAWESDNRLAPWLGVALLGSGFYLGYMAWRGRRAAQQIA